MKVCRNAVEFVQVINEEGQVRICGWLKDGGVIGNLSNNTMEEIYHSQAAELIREKHLNRDYSNCNPNACPFVANSNVEKNFIELDEIPKFPPALYLAYENVCNYRCVMCTIPECMKNVDSTARENNLNRIDSELLKVLPYVKKISANGLGELFSSKHILKLLAEWKPIANVEDCSVELETNGSLFNEQNWEKIKNLGQYHLAVTVTILSFDEPVYQELSGTELPISNLINNLYFIKSLREKGIINHLTLATVYQERNFRTLPEFTKRCLEEFSADYVRLRPFEPWREVDMKDWFKDVRNKYHPYHNEFLETMKDPIFRNPKVHDWGGGKESGLGPEPYMGIRNKFHILENIFCNDNFMERLKKNIKYKHVVVYGMSVIGRALVNILKDIYEIPFCMDRAMNGQQYAGISIYDINNIYNLARNVTVIVSLERNEDAVISLLVRVGFEQILSIKDLMGDCIG